MPFDPDLVQRTRGFMPLEEGRHLHRLAAAAAALGPCLEIGSYCGRSTVCLGLACRDAGQILIAVDHHRGSEEQQPGEEYFDPALFDAGCGRIDTLRPFQATLARAGLDDTVVPVVCRSALAARAWPGPLSLVFIDGGHAPETVQADYDAWSPRLVPGGILALHDVFPDPADGGRGPYLVYRAALASGRFAPHSALGSLAALRRA
jgi:predicted O-methyltransferase YrrM